MGGFAKKGIKRVINILAMNKLMINIFNNFYEHAPASIVRKLEPILNPPAFDYTWKIRVNNKKIKFTYLKNESRIVFHFPLSYKKNDTPLKELEFILHQHYPIENYYLDIGANFGLRSLFYLVHKRPCILFEPTAECNVITNRLIKENGFQNVQIVSKMVGSENKFSDFHLSKSTYLSSAIKEQVDELDDFKSTIKIEEITIDFFIELKKLKNKVKIIKIDVEGYEYEVCKGAEIFLESENVSLLIEIKLKSKNAMKLFNILEGKGYAIYNILQSSKLKLIACKVNFFVPDGSVDYLVTNDEYLIKKLKKYISV